MKKKCVECGREVETLIDGMCYDCYHKEMRKKRKRAETWEQIDERRKL